jgi:hypothetical protein
MKSLATNPIEFYSCFISYSTMDQEFADRLHAHLQNKNVRCWFAPHDVQGGKKLHDQIDEAIRDWECFDADAGKDSAREIREYFIPDFSEWKNHDKYKKAFDRLLGDLKAGKRSD